MSLLDVCNNKIIECNNDNNINLIINDYENNNNNSDFEFDFNTFLNIGKELYYQDCKKKLSDENLNRNFNQNFNENFNQNSNENLNQIFNENITQNINENLNEIINNNIKIYKIYKNKKIKTYLVVPMVILLFISMLYNITVKIYKKVEVINNIETNIMLKKMRLPNDF